jgi:hypothetical protein
MDNIRLRDYFAGLAMQSLLSHKISGISHPPNPAGLAKEAYLYADALLEISIIKVPPPKPTPMPFKLTPPEPKSGKIRP